MRKVFTSLSLGVAFTALSYACAQGNGETDPPVVETVEASGDDAGARPDAPRVDGAVPAADGSSGSDASVVDSSVKVDAAPDAPAIFDEAGTFMVVRVGTAGSGVALSAAAAAVFIEERRFGDGVVTQTIPMPVAAAGANAPFTLRGTATTEGALALSGDDGYVVLAGYGATPGTADVAATSAATTPRVVARVTKAGAIDTSTRLGEAFDAKSVRGAASADGTGFWVSGENGNGSTGGVYFVDLGTTGGTQILDAPQNLRVVGLFGGQLYANTQSGAAGNTLRLFSVGAGMPTTAGQTGTQLPGITDANTTPHGFVMLDLDGAVAGVDTMYVADTRSLASGGGVQKWKLAAGGAWSLVATFKTGLTGAPVAVTAKPLGASVAVVCVTLDNPAKIVRFVDDGVTPSPAGTTLGTGSATFAQYRGVALTPD